jgi:fatty acid synthase
VALPLYSQQLNKDLIMNVYSGGKWGSYRHLPLDSCATVSTPHAWLNIMTPGDLSSFRWLEGNLVPERYGLALVSRTAHAFIHLGVDF